MLPAEASLTSSSHIAASTSVSEGLGQEPASCGRLLRHAVRRGPEHRFDVARGLQQVACRQRWRGASAGRRRRRAAWSPASSAGRGRQPHAAAFRARLGATASPASPPLFQKSTLPARARATMTSRLEPSRTVQIQPPRANCASPLGSAACRRSRRAAAAPRSRSRPRRTWPRAALVERRRTTPSARPAGLRAARGRSPAAGTAPLPPACCAGCSRRRWPAPARRRDPPRRAASPSTRPSRSTPGSPACGRRARRPPQGRSWPARPASARDGRGPPPRRRLRRKSSV